MKISSTRRGFTLIEMMIVVAIIAILALMAIPNLTGKYVREQIAEGVTLSKLAKDAVSASWATTKALPDDNAAAGLPVADKIVSNVVQSVTVEGGAVHIVFGNRANGALKGKTLTLRPAIVEDAPVVPVAWVCAHAKAPDKMKLIGANRTDIERTYLPMNCL
jgi:type IV pilus assembly protein PilA